MEVFLEDINVEHGLDALVATVTREAITVRSVYHSVMFWTDMLQKEISYCMHPHAFNNFMSPELVTCMSKLCSGKTGKMYTKTKINISSSVF